MTTKNVNEPSRIEYDSLFPPLKSSKKSKKYKPQEPEEPTPTPSPPEPKNLVVINMDERRFKEFNSTEIQNILKSVCHRFSVRVNPSYTSYGSFVIEVIGESEENIKKGMYALQEQLSRQHTLTLQINPRSITRFVGKDKRNLSKFNREHLVDVKVDYDTGKIFITGGKNCVQNAKNDISDFISLNIENYDRVLDVSPLHIKFLSVDNQKRIKEILYSAGNVLKFIPPDSTLQKSFVLSGKKSCVEKAIELFKAECAILDKEFETVKVSANKFQLEPIKTQINFDRLMEVQIAASVSENLNGDVTISIMGKRESQHFKNILTKIEAIKAQNEVSMIKTTFHTSFYLKNSLNSLSAFFQTFANYVVRFSTSHDEIYVIGPSDHMENAKKCISEIVMNTSEKIYHETVPVPNEYASYVVGKDQSNLKSITQKWDVVFFYSRVPSDSVKNETKANEDSSYITVIGTQKNVESAKEEIHLAIKKRIDFVTIDVEAPNHLHKHIIGSKGRALKETLDAYGSDCSVTFGKSPDKLDSCIIKGPAKEAALLAKTLESKIATLAELHHRIDIPLQRNFISVFSDNKFQFRDTILSLGIENLIIPAETEKTNIVTVIGPKKAAIKAKEVILQKFDEISKFETVRFPSNDKFNALLNELGTNYIKCITLDSGGHVDIVVPQKGFSDKNISLTGQKSSIQFVLNVLKQAIKGDFGNYCYDKIGIPQKYSQLVAGPKGKYIFKIVVSTGVRTFFLSASNSEFGTILIVGPSDKVKITKEMLNKEIKSLEDTIEERMNIPFKYKKDFLFKRGDQEYPLSLISKENGNVTIFIGDCIPKTDQAEVTIKGSKSFVPAARESILAFIKSLESRTKTVYSYKSSDLQNIVRRNKWFIKEIMEKIDARITIPQDFFDVKARSQNEMIDIVIVGTKESIAEVIRCFDDFKFVTKSYQLNHDREMALYGADGKNSHIVINRYGVKITMDPEHEPNKIFIHGFSIDVDNAIDFISNLSEQFYHHTITIDSKYFTRLIGKGGQTVKDFNRDNNVVVKYPRNDSEEPDKVLIVGNKENCFKAADKLLNMVSEWESEVSSTIPLDMRVKSSLFGPNASNIKKICQDFNVSFKLGDEVSETSPGCRKLVITGLPDNVSKAREFIQAFVSNALEDIEEISFYQAPKVTPFELDVSSFSSFQFVKETHVPVKKKPKKKSRSKEQTSKNNSGKSSRTSSRAGQLQVNSDKKSPEQTTTSEIVKNDNESHLQDTPPVSTDAAQDTESGSSSNVTEN